MTVSDTRGGVAARQDVGHEVAVRAERPLWRAGGAAGVEDRGIVIRGQSHCRQRRVGEVRPVVGRADHILQPLRALAEWRGGAGDDHPFQRGKVCVEFLQPDMALAVDDQHPRARIAQAVFQLGSRPPRIERHHDRADRHRREKGDGPFGQIAHRQRDPIALADAERHQMHGERGGGAVMRLVAHPLVLVYHEQPIGMATARLQQIPHRRRRVLPDAGRYAADIDVLHLELRAGGGQQRLDLGQRHRRPGRRQGHDRFARHNQLPLIISQRALKTRVSMKGYS